MPKVMEMDAAAGLPSMEGNNTLFLEGDEDRIIDIATQLIIVDVKKDPAPLPLDVSTINVVPYIELAGKILLETAEYLHKYNNDLTDQALAHVKKHSKLIRTHDSKIITLDTKH